MILQKITVKTFRKLQQPLMLFGLFFSLFPPFFVIEYNLLWRCLGLDSSRKTCKAVLNYFFFIHLRAYTQLVKISIVLLTSTALHQLMPAKQLACRVLAFQDTLPTYPVGFYFARWKVTYGANCTT